MKTILKILLPYKYKIVLNYIKCPLPSRKEYKIIIIMIIIFYLNYSLSFEEISSIGMLPKENKYE